MIRENVSTQETVTVQLIKGAAPINETTLGGCGMPSITLDRVVQGVSVIQPKGEANDNNN